MNQQPDKLFRDKLEGYHKSAPPTAWSRLERKLDKKKRKPLLFKLAAAVLLLLCSSVLWWLARNTERHESIATSGIPAEHKEVTPKTVVPDSVDSLTSEKAVSTKTPKSQQRKEANSSSRKKRPSIQSLHTADKIKNGSEGKEISNDESGLIDPDKSFDITRAETVLGKENKERTGVTIIYTLDEVNEKYLNKKNLAQATPESKKPSTLKKLLDKAYDLKHNQDAFGELRQKKNEILALNFKNEKQQRTQNR